ncbi:hypothetical protein FISHEDRAFT_7965, partial [Fistulina hepatica ATCC 64428]
YQCTYIGCGKAYTKPSRLEEHERSHTGERPFVCQNCNKSYFRETHLQAHARSHLPASDRPLACTIDGCDKRFWTPQHLRAHIEWHSGAKPFSCSQADCNAVFAKHHQLRTHMCTAHAPPGTKPYQCDHDGCNKSFDTNQHLHAHIKTHDTKRYACSYTGCLSGDPVYFQTWSALQHHIRTAHPAVCEHPSCHGRVFASQRNLRMHQKLHEEREVEEALSDAEEDCEPPRTRRRGGELGRDWKCDVEGCGKDFKSKSALTTHNNVTHVGRRDFVCAEEGCGRAFGHKHLLQRHQAKLHAPQANETGADENATGKGATAAPQSMDLSIAAITGMAYVAHAREKLASASVLRCPYPGLKGFKSLDGFSDITIPVSVTAAPCEYVFSRAYDLRRHFRSAHGFEV